MNPVEHYILALDEPYQSISFYLRGLIKKTLPEAEEKFKWNCPFYDFNGKYMCYINFRKDRKLVDLAFVQGVHLTKHPELLIDGENRKQIRSVRIKTLEEVPETKIQELLIEASLLQ